MTLALSGILSNPTIIGVAVYGADGALLHRFGKFRSETHQVFKASHDISNFDGTAIVNLGRLETVSTDKHIVESFRQRREFYGLVFAVLFVAIVIATYTSIHLVVGIPLKRLVAVKIDATNTAPSKLLGAGASWAMSFSFDAIKKAVDNA